MTALGRLVREGFLFHNAGLFFWWKFLTMDKGIGYEKFEKALF
jgi:hypothetical protein